MLQKILQIYTLSGFAVAQPLYSLLSSEAAFFSARGAAPMEIIFFTVVVSFLVPGLLIGAWWLIPAGFLRLKEGVFLGLVALLATLIVLPTAGLRG